MKKINTSLKAQARRARALARFVVNPEGDPAYQARKAQELAALKSRLNTRTP
jgi:hypothetical protein